MSDLAANYFLGTGDAFEKLLRNPSKADQTVALFIKIIDSLKNDQHVSLACFLDAEGQPSGALHAIMPSVKDSLQLRTCVWSRESNGVVGGFKPVQQENCIIVYDVCLTGRTLSEVANQLRHKYGAQPKAAVVYLNKGVLEELRMVDEDVVVPVIDVASGRKFVTDCRVMASKIQDTSSEREGVTGTASSSLVHKAGIEPTKEGEMTHQRTNTYWLAAMAFSPLLVYFALALLTALGVFPRETLVKIRDYVTILAK